jgi:predicted Zn-dependent protease
MPQMTVALLAGLTNAAAPELQVRLAQALHDLGAYRESEALWRTNETRFAADPELRLRRAAVRELYGKPDEAAAAQADIEHAARGGPGEALANRLLMQAARLRRDVSTAQDALNRLVDLRADRTADHLGFWAVLVSVGRATEAGALIKTYPRRPETFNEAIEFFDLAQAAGLARLAEDIQDEALRRYPINKEMCWRKAIALNERRVGRKCTAWRGISGHWGQISAVSRP